MNKTLNIEAIKLMQENKFEEAYDAFTKLIDEHKNNYEAIYFRAIVDFGHLKKHFETTLEDLSHLAMFKNPYQIPSVQIVTIMYDMNDNYDMVIIYGEKALKLIDTYNNTPVDLKVDIYYALARAYFHKYSNNDLKKGLEYIDKCFKMLEDDVDIEYYLLKIDILVGLKEYEEAKKIISKAQATFGNAGDLYYAREKVSYAIGLDKIAKGDSSFVDDLDDALRYLEIFEKYSDNKFVISLTRVEIYTALKRYDDAISELDKIQTKDNIVNISGNANVENANIYGGNKAGTGNILNIAADWSNSNVKSVNNFNEINFEEVKWGTAALEVAKHNATKLEVNVKYIINDMLENLANKYDVIVSNPPYIKTNEEIEEIVKNNGTLTNEEVFWNTFTSVTNIKQEEIEPEFTKFYETRFDLINTGNQSIYMIQAVSLLKEKGYRLLLATNPLFPSIATEKRIKWAGLNKEDFEWITTYENSSYAKPNPSYYKEIIDKLKLDVTQCLMVGNDVKEDCAITSLGIPVYLINDYLLNKYDLNNLEDFEGSLIIWLFNNKNEITGEDIKKELFDASSKEKLRFLKYIWYCLTIASTGSRI